MNHADFLKLIGAETKPAEYLPVAFLLKSGYAAVGYYNAAVNAGLTSAAVLLNARLIDLSPRQERGRNPIRDFNDFLEEVVTAGPDGESDGEREFPAKEEFGRPTPIAAFPLAELAVVYPVAHIHELVRRSKEKGRSVPAFFDLGKSEILNLLRTRLW